MQVLTLLGSPDEASAARLALLVFLSASDRCGATGRRFSARRATASRPRRASSPVAEGRAQEALGVRTRHRLRAAGRRGRASSSTSTASATTPASPAATPRPASNSGSSSTRPTTRTATATNPARGPARWWTATASISTASRGCCTASNGRRRQGSLEARHEGEVPLPPELLRRRQRAGRRRRPAHRAGRRQREGPAAGRLPRREAERHRHRRVRQEDRAR